MRQIKISDATMKQISEDFRLSFKEKIELAKLLDKLGVDIIELEGIKNARIDSLQIKSIAAAVNDSIIAVPVELDSESVKETYAALREAKRPRLQVVAPTSSVQIEYISHKKPEAMLAAISKTVKECCELCPDVEFVASDATRSDADFLVAAIEAAINAGAKTVTLEDSAGTMLPTELDAFIKERLAEIPKLNEVELGVATANTISLAEAAAVAAIAGGAAQVRAAAYPINLASLSALAEILNAKSDALGAFCAIRTTQLSRIKNQIIRICQPLKSGLAVSVSDAEDGIFLTAHDGIEAVARAVKNLGYDLSNEDEGKVFGAFSEIAAKKERVSLKELDAIVASSAMQVPSTYKLDTYLITSGNTVSATAHIKLMKNGEAKEGVYIGDGSIDAAFQAIEKITGCHYELDDFQLQAVTEGREAMGETVVKLRSRGRVYSGKGISTDIVGAGIQAYLNALNKIIYEEDGE